jgi:LemA protein
MGMTGIVIGVIVVALILYGIVVYNGLVRARQVVQEAWSGIDVQLKRRADLIPNLVETVRGYTDHEANTLREVTEMRARAQAVPKDC